MNLNRYLGILLALALLTALIVVATKRLPKEGVDAKPLVILPTTASPTTTVIPKKEPPRPAPERLNAALAQLANSRDGETSRRLLTELRQFLDSLPADVASREVQSFLATNQDAATNLEVTVKPGGRLGDASSLRVFLLDYLGQIDRPAAGALAVQVLTQYTAADEWAVSLRNYAWANPTPDSESFLQQKSRELLSNPEWIKKPSAGFLEAFDTIVYAHGTTLIPELSTLVRDKENKAISHAAYLTLDRLTLAEPAVMLTQLVEQPGLMQGREQTRANYLARADVRSPEQRALVEQYLLDPQRLAEELATFAGLYPNANYMISSNLLTATTTPKHADLAAQDVAALEAVRAWQDDRRFVKLLPYLETMRARLETFVRQAAANP